MTSPPGRDLTSSSSRAMFPQLRMPRAWVILTGAAGVVIVGAGIHAVAGVVAPVFLALIFTIVSEPVSRSLRARGAPGPVAVLAALAAVYGGLAILAILIIASAAELVQLLPTYAGQAGDLVDGVQSWLSGLGFNPPQADSITSSIDPSKIVGVVTSALGGAVSLATNLLFILALVMFTTAESMGFTTRFTGGGPERSALVAAMSGWVHRTRRYFLVSTVFGAIVAVIDALFLWIVGVPGAVLWGVLAFITNYVPNIGFVIGLIPPALLALLKGGPGLMLLVIVVYSVINAVIQSVIQPKVVGDAVGLSATVTFLSLIVWTVLLGGLGALLAVPLSLFVKALFLDSDPDADWFRQLVGDTATAPLEESSPP